MKKIIGIAFILLLAGCATQSKYEWGAYEYGLYQYYKNPENLVQLATDLQEVVENSESKVPPGIYAEYGYLLLVQGKNSQAAKYFKKEKAAWPESKFLMDKVIAATKKK